MIETSQPDGGYVLNFDGKRIPFRVEYRQRKTLAITVHPDLRLEIVAPEGTTSEPFADSQPQPGVLSTAESLHARLGEPEAQAGRVRRVIEGPACATYSCLSSGFRFGWGLVQSPGRCE
jgi:hypothetical protein